VDLFCGAGGLALGFNTAGCRIIGGVDRDEVAARSFLENLRVLQRPRPPLVISGVAEADLSRPEAREAIAAQFSRVDIVLGGPPCQAFSKIGRGKLNSLFKDGFAADPRNILYKAFVELVQCWQPKAFVMENVPGMLSVLGKNIAEVVAAELAGLGYRVGYALLNAAWYGVPQLRERLFFIGIRKDLRLNPRAPEVTHSTNRRPNYSDPRTHEQLPLFDDYLQLRVPIAPDLCAATTVREALDDLPRLTKHLEGPGCRNKTGRLFGALDGTLLSSFGRLMRNWPGLQAPRDFTDHVFRHNPRDYETFRRMRPGDRYPEALALAETRLKEKLDRLAALEGTSPAPSSAEYDSMRRGIVPPYPSQSFGDKWGMLIPDKPSWTVPAHLSKDGYSHIHYDPAQARTLTIREAARLQSFPDGFSFAGNMGGRFGQIGNAVPPLLAWAVAASVMTVLGFRAAAPPLGLCARECTTVRRESSARHADPDKEASQGE